MAPMSIPARMTGWETSIVRTSACCMNAANKALETNAAENAFFKTVWDSQKEFAKTAIPFWAGSQTSNANLGRAYADQLAKK